jgi:hypothetical protein
LVARSSLSITSSTISGNLATNGGGIYNTGAANITGSSISDNESNEDGGGILNSGSVIAVNSTIANNITTSNGGGVVNAGGLTFVNVTIADNSATLTGGGIDNQGSATANLGNTLIARNTSGTNSPDVAGAFNDLGGNLIGNSTGSTGWALSTLVGTATNPINPRLSTLGNYGGPTPTFRLLPGSPALNGGSNALAINPLTGTPLEFDQLGQPRILNGTVDIGAVESTDNSLLAIQALEGAGFVTPPVNFSQFSEYSLYCIEASPWQTAQCIFTFRTNGASTGTRGSGNQGRQTNWLPFPYLFNRNNPVNP